MRKSDVENFFNDKKQSVTIELLYARNKSKGVSKDFIELLVYQNQKETIKLLNGAHSFEEFTKLIRENYEKLSTHLGSIFMSYIMGESCGIYDGSLTMVPVEVAKRVLDNHVRVGELKTIVDLYKDVFINYINSHKSLKHKLLKSTVINGSLVADFTEEIHSESFMELSDFLFKPVKSDDWNRKSDFLKFICSFLAIYDKDILLNHFDFVKFEMEYGYFDRYYEILEMREEIPSLDDRISKFHLEGSITSEQQYRLENLDLLEKRIRSLKYPSKVIFLEKIEMIRQETDIKRKAELVDECFAYYEKEYRKEIVESVFSPECSLEVSDYRTLKPAMLHLFFRDPMKRLSRYEDKVKSDILARRGVKVTGQEELTEEEIQEYQSKVDYAINVLLNPVVTSKSIEGKTFYSDASGLRWYQSDTSNQISVSLFGADVLMHLPNCVGVGFDQTSIHPSNIIISSGFYQTTNMGVDNLEVNPEYRFKSLSSPLSELSKASKTEIVMYRERDGITTDAAYVFAIVNGLDEKKDRETILKAKEYAEKNQIKLVVFNILKLRKSQAQMLEEPVEEIEKKSRVL